MSVGPKLPSPETWIVIPDVGTGKAATGIINSALAIGSGANRPWTAEEVQAQQAGPVALNEKTLTTFETASSIKGTTRPDDRDLNSEQPISAALNLPSLDDLTFVEIPAWPKR